MLRESKKLTKFKKNRRRGWKWYFSVLIFDMDLPIKKPHVSFFSNSGIRRQSLIPGFEKGTLAVWSQSWTDRSTNHSQLRWLFPPPLTGHTYGYSNGTHRLMVMMNLTKSLLTYVGHMCNLYQYAFSPLYLLRLKLPQSIDNDYDSFVLDRMLVMKSQMWPWYSLVSAVGDLGGFGIFLIGNVICDLTCSEYEFKASVSFHVCHLPVVFQNCPVHLVLFLFPF